MKTRSHRSPVRVVGLVAALALSACPKPPPVEKPPATAPAGGPQATLGRPSEPPRLTLRQSLAAPASAAGPVLDALSAELAREMEGLKSQAAPPYFIAYQVIESQKRSIRASLGALEESSDDTKRELNIDLRVGDYKTDNTNAQGLPIFLDPTQMTLPLDDDAKVIRSVVWRQTEQALREAQKSYEQVKTALALKVAPEDTSDDFSRESPVQAYATPVRATLDKAAWEARIKRASATFKKHPHVLVSNVTIEVLAENRYLVTSEGTRLQTASTHVRLSVYGSVRAADGMDLERFEAVDAATLAGIPSEAEFQSVIEQVAADLEGLRTAPPAEPYTGPAILAGRATGVFFHEIFGHRVEGHRQKSEDEGQTFTKKIGQPIMPSFVSVFDDPRGERFGTVDLNGHYLYDDQGVPAQRAELVKDGVLQGFLLARAPVKGFPRSNGHGRRQSGFDVVARQGNLTVTASRAVSEEELRQLLREEAKRQGKEYGLYFLDISGGFTNTGRFAPQAFKVLPVMVYRVYVDGRPDELIRGVDIVGTPLTALGEILAANDKYEIFNGYCGAESGFVPVSAIGPGLLIRQIETERRAKGELPPPALPAPTPTQR